MMCILLGGKPAAISYGIKESEIESALIRLCEAAWDNDEEFRDNWDEPLDAVDYYWNMVVDSLDGLKKATRESGIMASLVVEVGTKSFNIDVVAEVLSANKAPFLSLKNCVEKYLKNIMDGKGDVDSESVSHSFKSHPSVATLTRYTLEYSVVDAVLW